MPVTRVLMTLLGELPFEQMCPRLRDIGRRLPYSSRWTRLALWQRRALKTLAAIGLLVVLSTVLYHYVMLVFENRSPALAHSFQVVVETYTGTGYGSDAEWESVVANVFVSLMDLSTFLLVFLVVPYVFRPVIENALSPEPRSSVDLSNHIVVCGVEQQGERLIDELESQDVEYVVIVESEQRAVELMESGATVIAGNPTAAETHRNACVEDASAVVVDIRDDQSVSVVLTIREVAEDVRTVVLVEDLEHEQHLSYAGADRVLTPRHLLGRRIAKRITTGLGPARSTIVTAGDSVSILELTVFPNSPIHGESLDTIESTAGETVTVLGLWVEGTFVESPDSDTTVDEDTVLLVGGRDPDIRRLERATYQGRDVQPTVIIAGYGHVGSTVRDRLQHSTANCTVVDIDDGEEITVVGDVTEEESLRRAALEDATVFVVTIGDDDDAILATLLADRLVTGLDIIVRLDDPANEQKARRAGADYVLSLPELSGRVLAQDVLREERLSYSRQLETVRIDATPFAGRSLAEIGVLDTDCIVVAVERGDELLTDIGTTFTLEPDDRIIVVGSEEALETLRD